MLQVHHRVDQRLEGGSGFVNQLGITRAGFGRKARVRLTLVASASYAALYAILLILAPRGVPLVDSATLGQLGAWAIATAAAAGLTSLRSAQPARHPSAV